MILLALFLVLFVALVTVLGGWLLYGLYVALHKGGRR